ncbi:hypothetical protein WA538_005364, partial [Blastocystis sp. DL]
MPNSVEEVRLTANDAIISKMSCVELGYYKDRYIHNFIKRQAKRTPIINRGYYSRVAAIEEFVTRFIHHYDCDCQILCLGAGYDTLLFRLHDMGLQPKLFVDLDLEETCITKATIIRHKSELSEVVYGNTPFDVHDESPSIATDHYILHPVDLTDIKSMRLFISQFITNKDLPTLILAECVLIYINPDSVNPTLQYLQSVFPNSGILVYEQIRPNDPFGSMMVKNLHERGCDLLSIRRYPEREDEKSRYAGFGYTCTFCEDMNMLYSRLLDPSEIRRVSRIEMFDEYEEWYLIQSHYCITIAAQGSFEPWFEEWV